MAACTTLREDCSWCSSVAAISPSSGEVRLSAHSHALCTILETLEDCRHAAFVARINTIGSGRVSNPKRAVLATKATTASPVRTFFAMSVKNAL